MIAPVFERRAPGVYHNSAAVIDADGTIAGVYRKMHIPDDPAYYEKFYFTPGDLGFRAFDTRAGRIGILICWDQWYPEGGAPDGARRGERPLLPDGDRLAPPRKAGAWRAQRDAWRTVQRGHAIANGVYVAAVNRVGHEIPAGGGDGIEFWGSSFFCDPQGVVLAEASADREEILSPRSTRPASRRSGGTGRSCGTGGSTPTAGSRAASSTIEPWGKER